MKICVYTIAKDEEQFVDRWTHSVRDADYKLVLDTGSQDRTVIELVERGVHVSLATIKPWRFDDARNAALALVPDWIDICVALDMDEVLTPNWRKHIEDVWQEDTTRLHYKYVWSWTPDGRPDRKFYSDKIAGRHTHRWKHPIHECLVPKTLEVLAVTDEVVIEHYPDETKSRGFYLDLLQLAVQEDPFNDRNCHYLGREYFFHERYQEAIVQFGKHLQLPTSKWISERAASFRYGAKCFEAVGNLPLARKWFAQATLEDPGSREALVDLSAFLLRRQDYLGTLYFAQLALAIDPEQSSYINERYALEEGPHDLSAVALHYLGDRKSAIPHAERALQFNPSDPRLMDNLKMIRGES